MSDEIKIPEGTVHFIDVRKPGRPVANNTLVVDQQLARHDGEGKRISGEKTVMIGSDGEGIYTILKGDANRDAKIKGLLSKMERENKGEYPSILGPFADRIEAFKEMHDKREKTPEESVTLLKTETVQLREALELAQADGDSEAVEKLTADLKAQGEANTQLVEDLKTEKEANVELRKEIEKAQKNAAK